MRSVTFRCAVCVQNFEAEPSRVESDPAAEHHPFRYFATCRFCEAECQQAAWERALTKAWSSATGPNTDEGKAATAKNLKGHPTPEEALRTRFNAMKHGLNARTATYFPAKPDGYVFCTGCEVDRYWCGQQSACVKQTEKFLLHHAAFEQRKPGLLLGMYADFQSSVFAMLQMIVQSIIAEGVQLKKPVLVADKEGNVSPAKYLDSDGKQHIIYEEIQAHPLFKPLGDLLSKNNLSLADMGVTQRVIERDDDEMGNLKTGVDNREVLEDVARSTSESLANLTELMRRSADMRKRDPVLIEHDAQEGGRA